MAIDSKKKISYKQIIQRLQFAQETAQRAKLRETTETISDATQIISFLAEELDRAEEIMAASYQLAGPVGAPVRFLDALSNQTGDLENLCPVTFDECEEIVNLKRALKDCLGTISEMMLAWPKPNVVSSNTSKWNHWSKAFDRGHDALEHKIPPYNKS